MKQMWKIVFGDKKTKSSDTRNPQEVVPDPDSAQPVSEFYRSWVEPSSHFPTSETGIDCDTLVWNLNKRDVYRLVLDTCLAPTLATTKSVRPYITQVAWSPAGMLQYGRCLLASVTNYGCVLVHVPRVKQWLTVTDISSLWTEHCSQNWDDAGDASESISILQSRAEQLKATAVTWSNLMSSGSKDFGLLVVGLLNGDVVVWRINPVDARRNKDDLQPQILLHLDAKMHRITALHWRTIDRQTYWLCVGDVRGVVRMFSLSMVRNKLHCTLSTDVWPYSDRIQVSKLLTVPCDKIDSSSATIVALKGGFVVAVALDSEGTVVATFPHLVGNLSVTGVVVLDKQRLMVVTHSGSFSLFRVVRNGSLLKLEEQVLSSFKVPKSAYYGIAASSNKAIFCLVTSFCVLFDHLIQRDPTQLTFFKLCDLVDPYALLLSNESQSLRQYWDCLEIIRLQGPPFRKLSDRLDDLSTYQLKMQFWLYRFSVVQGDVEENPERHMALKEELKRAEQLILNRHACVRASELMRQDCLTSEDQQSLSLLLSWLQKVNVEMSGEGPTYTMAKDVLRRASKFQYLMDSEHCSICDQKCDRIENPTESQCPAGHSLPRCCHSLLQCSDVPFWICRVCHSISRANSGLLEAPVCVFCDSFLYLDDRLLLPGMEEEEEEEEEVVTEQIQEVEVDLTANHSLKTEDGH
ncbi:uncharacterized protein LOC110827800 isoform X2 [Zootermopsis nevadensis]|uniref:uncharacterized protein LOC110827800 isoform X2 n=1 Tax=Zootermopsis nevadensis TaxID=136037 RepID=UPI000B8E2C34|nr:uncharacterized protein LOC110827800 isoform X2 [Zootermopsis nevadensis]